MSTFIAALISAAADILCDVGFGSGRRYRDGLRTRILVPLGTHIWRRATLQSMSPSPNCARASGLVAVSETESTSHEHLRKRAENVPSCVVAGCHACLVFQPDLVV